MKTALPTMLAGVGIPAFQQPSNWPAGLCHWLPRGRATEGVLHCTHQVSPWPVLPCPQRSRPQVSGTMESEASALAPGVSSLFCTAFIWILLLSHCPDLLGILGSFHSPICHSTTIYLVPGLGKIGPRLSNLTTDLRKTVG